MNLQLCKPTVKYCTAWKEPRGDGHTFSVIMYIYKSCDKVSQWRNVQGDSLYSYSSLSYTVHHGKNAEEDEDVFSVMT